MDNTDIKTEHIHLQKMMLVPSSAQDPSSGWIWAYAKGTSKDSSRKYPTRKFVYLRL